MTTHTASHWIKKLKLSPHPEGGYYRETYRSREVISGRHLPKRYRGPRAYSTSIYFLLESKQVSAFHRLKSDEIWHFYGGSPITIYTINPLGHSSILKLGIEGVFQTVIKAGSWFGAVVESQNTYSLVGCSVSPGFDFRDFEMGDRQSLIKRYPRHKKIITKLTYEEIFPSSK